MTPEMRGPTPRAPYRVSKLFETVVAGDYCIGCGACASLPDSPISMEMDSRGQYQPSVHDDHVDQSTAFDVGDVCPFYTTVDEDALAAERFADAPTHHPYVGRYRTLYAGYARTGSFRDAGSSGGITSWILARLFEEDRIDGVLHVVPGEGERLFEFGVSRNVPELMRGAKSRYYPVEFSQVVDAIRTNPGRYAFVGVPCFVKAARLLAKHDTQLADSLKYFIAIFCGHLKTAAFAESFAWQLGVPPGNLRDFDFRVKLESRPAYEYGVRATGFDGTGLRTIERPVVELFGGNWGHGLFKPRACDYCDDIAGETADVSLGDAWLPEYHEDSRGTNIIVVRSDAIQRLIARGVADGDLKLDPIAVDRVYQSQSGNYRHRREGLAVRLEAREREHNWHPPKRVQPSDATSVSRHRRNIYRLRERISSLSHEVFKEAKRLDDFEFFRVSMMPLLKQYNRLYHPLWRRFARRVRTFLRRWRLP